VRAYLTLMKMRMPDRLDWAVDVDEALAGQRFPPMALLTLVENAVRHGVDPMEDGGCIRVQGLVEAGQARLSVLDDGAGMAELARPGTGLSNLRERMTAFFGSAARLELSENRPHGLRAELSWPLPVPESRP
jgi:LytS/YehU family sensor histidine kinase